MCLGKDEALAFCEEIWREVFELFPYEYVHIGGDEVNMKNWNRCPRCQARMRQEGLADGHALQAWFTRRMQRFFEAHDRRMIGWTNSCRARSIRRPRSCGGARGCRESVDRATRQGCDLIICPQTWFYFSLEEDAGSLKRTCNFRLVPRFASAGAEGPHSGCSGQRLGREGAFVVAAEYLFYPRLLIVAEKGWSPEERVSEEELLPRVMRYCARLDAEGINYRIPSLENFHEFCVFTDSTRSTVTCPLPGATLRYTLDGSVPTVSSPIYTGPITFHDDALLQVRAFHPDGRTGDWVKIRYEKCGFAAPTEVAATAPGLQTEWYFKRFPKCDAIGGAKADGGCVVDTVQFPKVAQGRRATGILFRGYIRVPENRSTPLRWPRTTAACCASTAAW